MTTVLLAGVAEKLYPVIVAGCPGTIGFGEIAVICGATVDSAPPGILPATYAVKVNVVTVEGTLNVHAFAEDASPLTRMPSAPSSLPTVPPYWK